MHQDKLNTEQFKVNGRDNRTAQVLGLSKVKDFFSGQGYEVQDIKQPWRNVVGRLTKNKQQYYFKLGSTVDISQGIKNEAIWNAGLKNKIVPDSSFLVPNVYDSGEFEGLAYFVMDYFSGELLSQQHQPASPDMDNWLDRITDCNIKLLSITLDLPKDALYTDMEEKKKQMFSTWQKFYEQVKEFDLSKVLEDIKLYEKYYRPALCHYDFVPWHMIKEGEKFVLIDAEHATSKGPRFYDVVYFFHRVYTSAQAPELAKKYLVIFKNKLDAPEQAEFSNFIRPILASRIIGGFWDAKNHGAKDMSYHEDLKREFLDNLI